MTNTNLPPSVDATLESFEETALDALDELMRIAVALKDLQPADAAAIKAAGADPLRLPIVEEHARLTVECAPFVVLDAVRAARRLRQCSEPWKGQHRQISPLGDALFALKISAEWLELGAPTIGAAAPANGQLVAEAASRIRAVRAAIRPLVEL